MTSLVKGGKVHRGNFYYFPIERAGTYVKSRRPGRKESFQLRWDESRLFRWGYKGDELLKEARKDGKVSANFGGVTVRSGKKFRALKRFLPKSNPGEKKGLRPGSCRISKSYDGEKPALAWKSPGCEKLCPQDRGEDKKVLS